MRVEFAASEVIARVPVTVPAEFGENDRLKFTLCPTASVKGSAKPDVPNADPVTLIAEMVTVAPPELVIVSGTLCEFPT